MRNKNYPNDTSGTLFDSIKQDHGFKNDAALARFLEINTPVISKMRHGKLPFGPQMILDVHDKTGLSIFTIRKMIASEK